MGSVDEVNYYGGTHAEKTAVERCEENVAGARFHGAVETFQHDGFFPNGYRPLSRNLLVYLGVGEGCSCWTVN
jgi:pyrimidine deaminase RibD-like protein